MGEAVARVARKVNDTVENKADSLDLANCKLMTFPVGVYKAMRSVTEGIHRISLANNELKSITSRFVTTFSQLRDSTTSAEGEKNGFASQQGLCSTGEPITPAVSCAGSQQEQMPQGWGQAEQGRTYKYQSSTWQAITCTACPRKSPPCCTSGPSTSPATGSGASRSPWPPSPPWKPSTWKRTRSQRCPRTNWPPWRCCGASTCEPTPWAPRCGCWSGPWFPSSCCCLQRSPSIPKS